MFFIYIFMDECIETRLKINPHTCGSYSVLLIVPRQFIVCCSSSLFVILNVRYFLIFIYSFFYLFCFSLLLFESLIAFFRCSGKIPALESMYIVINTVLYDNQYSTKGPASVAQLDASSDWRPGRRGFNPPPPLPQVSNILPWRLIMKYFLRSFSPFRWFKKGSCQFLAKECAQYWLTTG